MPARKKCVKCELHGEDEFYSGGHVRRCPYRQCPCENCQEHDQLLDRNRREHLKRREMRDKRMGEGQLFNDKVKLLRRQMDDRRSRGGRFNNNEPGICNDTEEEPIVLSSDTEGNSTDVDDHDDPIDVDGYRSSPKAPHTSNDGYLSDDLPDPEDYVFTSPRPLATTSTRRQTPTTSSLSSISPTVWTPSPTSSSSLVKKKPDTPVMVTLSSDSDEDQNFLVGGGGTKDWPPCPVKDLDCHKSSRSYEFEDGIKRFIPKEDDYVDVDDLLNDTTDEDENKSHEIDFPKSKMMGDTTDNDEPTKVEGSNALDNESNCNNNDSTLKPDMPENTFDSKNRKSTDDLEKYRSSEDNTNEDCFEDDDIVLKPEVTGKNDLKIVDAKEICDEAKDESQLLMPKNRPSRWDVPPPGLTLQQLSAPPPPVHHVAQVPIPPHLRGLLLGKGGHFIHKLRVLSGAAISLGPVYCTIEGSCGGVGVARKMIAERLKLRMF